MFAFSDISHKEFFGQNVFLLLGLIDFSRIFFGNIFFFLNFWCSCGLSFGGEWLGSTSSDCFRQQVEASIVDGFGWEVDFSWHERMFTYLF